METLNVCIPTQQYGNVHSGVGTYATYLIDGLAKKGHRVTVVCPETNKTEKNVNINYFEVGRLAFDPSPNNWLSVSLNFSRKLKKLTMTEKFDVIHFTDARESLFYSNDNTKVIGTVHDFYSAIAPKNPFWFKKHYPHDWKIRFFYSNINKRLERHAFLKLDTLISVCNYTADKLVEKYKIPRNKFQIIYNGVDFEKYLKIKDIYKKELNNNPIILFVGGNSFRKNLPLLIKSSPKIIREFPTTKFYVVGKDSKMIYMEKLSKKFGVDKNFVFLGYVTDEKLLQLYATSHIFVMPSLYESFAFAYLESMAFGTPVIGGNVGGSSELINHGANGFIVNPHDDEDLAKHIVVLLRNKNIFESMSKNCTKIVRKFSSENMVKKTIEVYNKIIL